MVADIFWRNNHFHVWRYNLIHFRRSNLLHWEISNQIGNILLSKLGERQDILIEDRWKSHNRWILNAFAFTDNWELELVYHWFSLHRKRRSFCFSEFLFQFSNPIIFTMQICFKKNYLSHFQIFFVNLIFSFKGADGLHCDESQFLCKNEKVIA